MISYELLMIVIRSSVRAEPAAPRPAVISNEHGAPEGGRGAAELYAAELAAGKVRAIRQVQREMHLGAPRAREVVGSYLDLLART